MIKTPNRIILLQFLILVLLVSSPRAQEVVKEKETKTPVASINGIAPDMTQKEVTAILGKPANTETTVLGLCWNYKNPAISVYFKKKGTVDQVTTKDPKASIVFKGKKFSVGDKLDDVKKLLGKPDLEEGSGKYKELYYNLATFVIYFKDGKVTHVNILGE